MAHLKERGVRDWNNPANLMRNCLSYMKTTSHVNEGVEQRLHELDPLPNLKANSGRETMR